MVAARLRARPARAGDVPGCVELLALEGARGAWLDVAWLQSLLAQRRLLWYVFEEAAGSRAVVRGCGISGFVPAARATQALREGAGDWVEALLGAGRGGAPPVLLDRAGQAHWRAAAALAGVALNFAIDTAPGAPAGAVAALAQTVFVQAHSGYGLALMLAEVRPWEGKAPAYRASLRAMGCAETAPCPRSGTQLLWLDAQRIAEAPYHVLQPLFVRDAPRLGLTPAQQDVLELAVLGADDRSIALALGVSPHTLHKRWRAIHARADAVLGHAPPPAGSLPRRGAEKRAPLVEYVRLHPQEIRPWPPRRR